MDGMEKELDETSSRLDTLDLEGVSPEDLLRILWERHGQRAAIGTSFQKSGLVLIDMAYRNGIPLRVFTIDTLRLPLETHRLMETIQQRYGLELERFSPQSEAVGRMIKNHGEHLFFDSVAKREYCCQIRKQEPNARALATLDVWVTGLRRDQSSQRSTTPRIQNSAQDGRALIKVSPIVDWAESDVDAYLADHGVPQNELYGQGYRSIGCMICTSPVLDSEDQRAGRWRWEKQESAKECGLHWEGGAGI